MKRPRTTGKPSKKNMTSTLRNGTIKSPRKARKAKR